MRVNDPLRSVLLALLPLRYNQVMMDGHQLSCLPQFGTRRRCGALFFLFITALLSASTILLMKHEIKSVRLRMDRYLEMPHDLKTQQEQQFSSISAPTIVQPRFSSQKESRLSKDKNNTESINGKKLQTNNDGGMNSLGLEGGTKARPLLPHNATGRAFVCITGQVKRFVGTKMKETILEPLRRQGYEVDVALIMSEDTLFSTNSKNATWQWSQFKSYQAARDYLSLANYQVVTNSSIKQLENPKVPRSYLEKMDKKNESDEWRRARVQNHARQFDALCKCYQALLQKTSMSSREETVTSENSNENPSARLDQNYYDFAIRVREDVAFEEPIVMNDILPLLYPENGTDASKGTVLGSDCRCFHGLNDRIAFVSREGFQNYFQGPWKHFTQADTDLNTRKSRYKNPETFIYYVYRKRLNMNVVRTSKVRGVVKYVMKNKGSQQEPDAQTTFEPARGEHLPRCGPLGT